MLCSTGLPLPQSYPLWKYKLNVKRPTPLGAGAFASGRALVDQQRVHAPLVPKCYTAPAAHPGSAAVLVLATVISLRPAAASWHNRMDLDRAAPRQSGSHSYRVREIGRCDKEGGIVRARCGRSNRIVRSRSEEHTS